MLSPEQLEMRKHGIGGSEVASVLGLNPFCSARQLWEEKLGLRPGFAGNSNTERGAHLEDGIAKWWCARTGGKVLEAPTTLKHPTLPHVFATPDRICELDGEVVVLSVKAPGYFSGKKWGGRVPGYYWAQCQYEAGLLEALGYAVGRCELAAIICDDLACFPIPYEPDTARQLHQRANDFFINYVLTGVEPEKGIAA